MFEDIINKDYKLYINGEWKNSSIGESYDVICPATNETIAKCAKASKDDVDCAVKSAQKAFLEWKKTSIIERSNILLKIADVLENNLEKLALIETINTAKPIGETLNGDIPQGIDHLRYFAGALRAKEGSATFIENNFLNLIIYEPIGVVGQIVPWNFPFLMSMWKIAPALACGNCIIFKPSNYTPLSILETVKLVQGLLPKGVLNILTGDGDTVGDYIINHPEIKKLAFTGSTSVGYKIAAAASQRLIPSTLELGGKSANIFFDDMPYQKALDGATLGILFNQGQVCSAGSRIFVQETIYEQFLEDLKEKFKNIKTGLPWQKETLSGALINKNQLNKCLNYINLAVEEGAKIAIGGKKVDTEELKFGNYLEPTILADVKNEMRVAQEEIFGPVACVIKFKDEQEVIRMANNSEYGLAGGVWSKDINKALRVAKAIETGRMWINSYTKSYAGCPFGGYKKSGLGREAHKMTLDLYRQVKNIIVDIDEN